MSCQVKFCFIFQAGNCVNFFNSIQIDSVTYCYVKSSCFDDEPKYIIKECFEDCIDDIPEIPKCAYDNMCTPYQMELFRNYVDCKEDNCTDDCMIPSKIAANWNDNFARNLNYPSLYIPLYYRPSRCVGIFLKGRPMFIEEFLDLKEILPFYRSKAFPQISTFKVKCFLNSEADCIIEFGSDNNFKVKSSFSTNDIPYLRVYDTKEPDSKAEIHLKSTGSTEFTIVCGSSDSESYCPWYFFPKINCSIMDIFGEFSIKRMYYVSDLKPILDFKTEISTFLKCEAVSIFDGSKVETNLLRIGKRENI